MTFPAARTQMACVLGQPIEHSLSPAIHNAALRHEGRNGVYLAFEVGPDGLAEGVGGLRRLGAVGCNLTVPHKETGVELATEVSGAARQVGAANTLVFRGDEVYADNTDVGAIGRELADHGIDVDGLRCVVLGAGGAARAAAWALAEAGGGIEIANRTVSRADQLAEELSGGGHDVRTVPWDDVPGSVARAQVIINATSVGLDGTSSPISPSALQGAVLGGCRLLLDLVYAPMETPLVRTARAAGLMATDGLGVLVQQAAEAYTLFWEADAPFEVMREAAWLAAGRGAGGQPGDRLPVSPIV